MKAILLFLLMAFMFAASGCDCGNKPQEPSKDPKVTAFGQIDWQCMNECTSQGHIYQYCQKICSY